MKRALLLIALLPLTACFLFPPTSDGGTTDGGQYGYGMPTLEVTINGTHFGPAAPDGNSSAQLVDQYDSNGLLFSSTFAVGASSQAGGASCSLGLKRESQQGVTGITLANYYIYADTDGNTADGTVAPINVESVSVAQGTWQCSGSACNGATFVISGLDAMHVEGYVAGSFQNANDASLADVVCSFYLPWSAYQP